MSKVWLITGCSSGFGKAIATAALTAGDTVVITARNPAKLQEFEGKTGALIAQLDVTWDDSKLASAVKDIISKTSRIDVLVNNAGYILTGGVEEVNREEVEATFNTNVFGQINVLRAVLPYMRAARSGVVANLGSIGGWHGSPAAGLYCATKACAAMISESLHGEVAHLGIKVVCIEPGYFRTNFLAPDARVRAAKVIEELADGTDGVHKALDTYNNTQPGDPNKAAPLIVDALTGRGTAKGRELPKRLLIGKDAYEIVAGNLDEMKTGMEQWKDIMTTTNADA